MGTSGRTILLFSLEPWGAMWYSKHHYAAELAKAHRVYFISPPDKWRPSDLLSFKLKLRTTPEGVIVVHYRNNLPLRALPPFLARWMHGVTARKLAKLLHGEGDILWCFHPTPLALQHELRTRTTRLIYHVVDPYQPFSTDIPCAKAADLVVAVNPWFLDHYRKLNPNILLIPHGVRRSDRDPAQPHVNVHRDRCNPYVVLAGGINKRLDYEMLIAMVQRLPDLDLVLAGAMTTMAPPLEMLRDRLLAMPNVMHVGVLPPDELSVLIDGSMAGLVAYPFEPVQDRPLRPYGSLKPLTYLTQLKPVITSINCFIPELAENGVYKVENTDEFVDRVREAMLGRLVLNEALVNSYLDRMTYGKLITRILGALPTGPREPA